MCSFVGRDLFGYLSAEYFIIDETDLRAARRCSACRRILIIGLPVNSDSEIGYSPACRRVGIELGFKIFEVKSEVQNVRLTHFLSVSGRCSN